MRRDTRHFELLLFQPESLECESAFSGQRTQIGRNRNTENLRLGDHQKSHGVNGRERTRRQHRPLHTLLSAILNETPQVGKIAELRLVHRRLCANGQGVADLSNDHADLPGRHLYPRMLCNGAGQKELEAETGHQHFRLISRLSKKRQGVVAGQLGAESLADQPDLRRTNAVDRQEQERQGGGRYNKNNECLNTGYHRKKLLYPLGSSGRFRNRAIGGVCKGDARMAAIVNLTPDSCNAGELRINAAGLFVPRRARQFVDSG